MLTTKEKRNYAIRELKRRASQVSFANYVLYTSPDYQMGWVHKELCEVLQQFIQDVIDKKSPRLLISMPPRAGKSELVSRKMPAFAFGRNPDFSIIATSYSAGLSERFSRDVQRNLQSEEHLSVFPDAQLGGKSSGYICTTELFEIADHKGTYRSVGVGGGITGMGADILIIDDPIKDRQEANSPTIRNRIWDWYTSTAYTRLSPGGGVIVMCTRWHVDDLIGRLMQAQEEGGDQWKIINYPAIAEVDEPHRKAGEALHPERYPLETLLNIKSVIGSYDWASLYQGRPTVLGGEIIKGAWFGYYDVLPPLKYRAMFVDTAQKEKRANDYQVASVWGLGQDGYLYLIDIMRAKFQAYELRVRIPAFWNKHKANDNGVLRRMYVEDKASGTQLIQTIKNKTRPTIPVQPIERNKDKYTRVMDVQGMIEAGYVKLPRNAPFLADFIAECEAFTADDSHPHDDQIDTMVDAIATMLMKNDSSYANLMNAL